MRAPVLRKRIDLSYYIIHIKDKDFCAKSHNLIPIQKRMGQLLSENSCSDFWSAAG